MTPVGVSSFGLKTFCTSEHYTVWGQFEGIAVSGGDLPGSVLAGWFYGDPRAAAISEDERWLVSVGCGAVAYHLAPPWRPYGSGPAEGQWFDVGRESGGERWFSSVRLHEGHTFLLRSASYHFAVTEYLLDADTRELTEVSRWVEEHMRYRAKILEGFDFLHVKRIECAPGQMHLECGPRGKYQVDLSGSVDVHDSHSTVTSNFSGVYDLHDPDQAERFQQFANLHRTGAASVVDELNGTLSLHLKREPPGACAFGSELRNNAASYIVLSSTLPRGSWKVRTPDGVLECPGGPWPEGPRQSF